MTNDEGFQIDTSLVDGKLMDMIADDPELGAKLEETLAALSRDPTGPGENAGKIFGLCGAAMEAVDGGPHFCVLAPGHEGDHDNAKWQDVTRR